MKGLLQYWPVAAFVFNLVAVWACWSLRALAKSEVERIVKAAVSQLSQTDTALDERVDGHQNRLTIAESQIQEIRSDIQDLPTKADLERVSGEVRGVSKGVDAANAGIQRLEGFFLARGVQETIR
ncbi:MAG: hypothetical protein ACK41C_10385 [Phenylobacterium sp.]|uniref:hypothetical protein n=1 Tax=Phenylobacterium sp. TaxID=1871053 RepID=UPI00391C0488